MAFTIWVATLTINEIKAFETYSGGSTRVIIINNDGCRPITDDELSKHQDTYIEGVAELLKSTGMNKEMLKAYLPKL